MTFFFRALVVVCSAIIATQALAQEITPSPAPVPPMTAMKGFMRGVYWPWERTAWPAKNAGMDIWQFTEKMLGELKQRYHCDVIWVVNIGNADAVKLAGLAQKHGIAVMPVATAMYDWRDIRTQNAARRAVRSTVGKLGGSPAITGYVLLDEPKRGDVDQLELARRALTELDPQRPAIAVAMLRQTEALARRTQIPFLVSDPYSFFGPQSPNGPNTPASSRAYYLHATTRTAAMARETGKTPWVMPQIFNDVWGDWHYDAGMNVVAEPGAYYHWRMPTIGETKWQIWQAIAAGAKGTVFYVLFPTPNPRNSEQDAKDLPGYRPAKPLASWPLIKQTTPLHEGTAIVRSDGSSTPQGEAMGEVFAMVEPHRELLGRLESAPPVAFADAPLRAATFRDPATNQTVVVVVNDNTDAGVTGNVQFLPKTASVTDLVAGTTLPARTDAATGLTQLSLQIGAGEGKLLVLEGETNAALTYQEDFGIQLSAGRLEGVEKILVPEAWGMGYRVAVKARPDAPAIPAQAAAADVTAGAAGKPVPAQLQYEMLRVAGDWKRMGGRLYLIYRGAASPARKNVEVAVSNDGKEFQVISTDEFNRPVAIPAGTAHLRLTLLNPGATLDGWQMIAVP